MFEFVGERNCASGAKYSPGVFSCGGGYLPRGYAYHNFDAILTFDVDYYNPGKVFIVSDWFRNDIPNGYPLGAYRARAWLFFFFCGLSVDVVVFDDDDHVSASYVIAFSCAHQRSGLPIERSVQGFCWFQNRKSKCNYFYGKTAASQNNPVRS